MHFFFLFHCVVLSSRQQESCRQHFIFTLGHLLLLIVVMFEWRQIALDIDNKQNDAVNHVVKCDFFFFFFLMDSTTSMCSDSQTVWSEKVSWESIFIDTKHKYSTLYTHTKQSIFTNTCRLRVSTFKLQSVYVCLSVSVMLCCSSAIRCLIESSNRDDNDWWKIFVWNSCAFCVRDIIRFRKCISVDDDVIGAAQWNLGFPHKLIQW